MVGRCCAANGAEPACLAKARSYFRKAGHDNADANSSTEISERRGSAQQAGDNRRQAENSAADDRVEHQRHKAPSAHGAHQFRLSLSAHPGQVNAAARVLGQPVGRGARSARLGGE